MYLAICWVTIRRYVEEEISESQRFLIRKAICDIFQTRDTLILAIISQDLPFLTAVGLAHFAIFYIGISNA